MVATTHIGSATTWGAPSAARFAVLIHGYGGASQTWSDVAPELAKHGYYVVAPDLLGHGYAPRSDSYQIDDLGSNIMPHVNHRKVDLLIGHSLGGAVALNVCNRLMSKPERLVLVDPALEGQPEILDMVRKFMLDNLKQRPSPVEFHKQNPRWTENGCVAESFSTCLNSPETLEYIGSKIHPWSFTNTLPPASEGINIVILRSELEAAFKEHEAEALMKKRPDIEVLLASGAGHNIHREKPEIVLRAALSAYEI